MSPVNTLCASLFPGIVERCLFYAVNMFPRSNIVKTETKSLWWLCFDLGVVATLVLALFCRWVLIWLSSVGLLLWFYSWLLVWGCLLTDTPFTKSQIVRNWIPLGSYISVKFGLHNYTGSESACGTFGPHPGSKHSEGCIRDACFGPSEMIRSSQQLAATGLMGPLPLSWHLVCWWT